MRDRVDAPRHAAHDHHPRARESGGELARRLRAVRRVVAAPDDADRRTTEQRPVTPAVEQRRRIGDFPQERWERRIPWQKQPGPEAVELRQNLAARPE